MQTIPSWIRELGNAIAATMPQGINFALIVYAESDPRQGYLVAALEPADARLVLQTALERLDEGPPDGAGGIDAEA